MTSDYMTFMKELDTQIRAELGIESNLKPLRLILTYTNGNYFYGIRYRDRNTGIEISEVLGKSVNPKKEEIEKFKQNKDFYVDLIPKKIHLD